MPLYIYYFLNIVHSINHWFGYWGNLRWKALGLKQQATAGFPRSPINPVNQLRGIAPHLEAPRLRVEAGGPRCLEHWWFNHCRGKTK